MIQWGVNAINHDASLSVFHNGHPIFASHSERFSKIKNDRFLCQELIDYALKYGTPDEIIWSEKPYLKKARQLISLDERVFDIPPKNHLKQFGIRQNITYVNHHETHAAAAAYTSNFNKALVFVFDGIGEFDTISVWRYDDCKLDCIYRQSYYHSLGLFYSAFTQLIGLKPNEEEFILMGMAGYGQPLYKDQLIETFFEVSYPDIHLKQNLHRGVNFNYTNKFDLAASVQKVYEELTQGICSYFQTLYNIDNACFSGGCALNCMANSTYNKIFKNVWVYPNAGDAGNSYGAVLSVLKSKAIYDPYIGYNIDREIDTDDVVNALINGEVVGIANGKAEFGPRALGNRSLIADPRTENIQNTVNLIKKREEFRPFAPTILEECFSNNFITDTEQSRFMNFVFHNKYPEIYKGITHIDGSSRVQTLNADSNTIFREILLKWYDKTGVPLLLNTSLNIKGQPLVNDERDALEFSKKYDITVF
jgi:carbamoyltransferase